MFARILRSRLKAEKIGEASKTFREDVLPLCREQRGFKEGYFLTDPITGESLFITFWESREAMLATEQSRFFQEQVARFIPFYIKPPVREAYEVALQEGAEATKS